MEQVEDAGVGLPVLQPLTGGQYVHQLLAVASESQFANVFVRERDGVHSG